MTRKRLHRLARLFSRPFLDAEQAISATTERFGWIALPAALAAMLASWWVYVPLHELFHAWGCLLAGGSVSKLEIDSKYGAAWIAHLVPYVVAASDYAGRLSGFDTHGSDLVYLATDFSPYLLTLAVGVPALHLATRLANPFVVGAALPWACAPIMALTGDFYEMGSIVVSRLAQPWWPSAPASWRSDDLPQLLSSVFKQSGSGIPTDVMGLAAGFLLGTLGAFMTYSVGAWISQRIRGRNPDQ